MSIQPIVTVKEADGYNKLNSEWLDLDRSAKENHIFNASAYMISEWTCSSFLLTNPSNIDDDVKRACAYYAAADAKYALFPDIVPSKDRHGSVTEVTDKIGSLTSTVKYSAFTGYKNYLTSIDTIMYNYCIKKSKTRRV
jgi:hypothetical protein